MRKNIIRLICLALIIMLLPGSVRLSADGCEGMLTPSQPKLEDYLYRINIQILHTKCCQCGWELSGEQMKVCVNEFYNVQNKYSGALMCEIDEKKYYYPKFILEWANRDYTVTEYTRYKIDLLPKNSDGIYTGIKVTAYENEKDAKIREINALIRKYRCSHCTAEQLAEVEARYRSFQSQYGGKYLCTDTYENKAIYCPDFTYVKDTSRFDKAGYRLDTVNVRWYTDVVGMNEDKIHTGLVSRPFRTYMGTPDVSVKDLIGLSKQFENDTAGLPYATGKTMEMFIPDFRVNVN